MPAFRYDPAVGSFKGWLLTKTRWCIVTQFRKRGRGGRPCGATTSSPPSALEEIPDPSAAPEEAWERDWQQTLFDAALDRVKKRANGLSLQMFDFYVRKETPAEEVAARFGVSVDQVYLAKHRITAELKKEIERLEREVT
jgi:RNA polymerase sigma factor (sigma-70 family)